MLQKYIPISWDIEKTTTLIRSPLGTWKTTALREIIMALKDKVHDISSLPYFIWISYRKSLSNESKAKLDDLKALVQVESLFRIEFTARPFVAILNEANAIMRQMSSGTNARERLIARALVEKASKLSKPDNSPVRARAYYGDMDGKQRQRDFSDINVAWGELDCLLQTSPLPVHVEALAQMLYRIRDCPRHMFPYSIRKILNGFFAHQVMKIFGPELASARPNNLPTAIKGHREWNNNTISYKVDESPAVITFIEVEHQKRLSARYFIEKLCSLIASTGASLLTYKNGMRVEEL
ncbi:unnamed protein product [Rhizophagus irregularis]|nr:unnamed protein product [Rhizophagus irregularis]